MTFESEADLCQALIESAKPHGWVAYAEQGGWDILFVRRGIQVGVQAKLVGNLKMLFQALPERPRWVGTTGPHYRAVVVSRWSGRTELSRHAHRNEIGELAQRLRLLVLEPPDPNPIGAYNDWLQQRWPFLNLEPSRYQTKIIRRFDWPWYRWHPSKLVWVPPFVPDLPAGVPSPRSVSAFQIACIQLERICNERGWICRDDVRAVRDELGCWFNLSTPMTRFFQSTGILVEDFGRQQRWVLRGCPPSSLWPEVAKGMRQ